MDTVSAALKADLGKPRFDIYLLTGVQVSLAEFLADPSNVGGKGDLPVDEEEFVEAAKDAWKVKYKADITATALRRIEKWIPLAAAEAVAAGKEGGAPGGAPGSTIKAPIKVGDDASIAAGLSDLVISDLDVPKAMVDICLLYTSPSPRD